MGRIIQCSFEIIGPFPVNVRNFHPLGHDVRRFLIKYLYKWTFSGGTGGGDKRTGVEALGTWGEHFPQAYPLKEAFAIQPSLDFRRRF